MERYSILPKGYVDAMLSLNEAGRESTDDVSANLRAQLEEFKKRQELIRARYYGRVPLSVFISGAQRSSFRMDRKVSI